MSCLNEWAAVMWRPPATLICQVAMTEIWLWQSVSLWWRSWNMIMIPNHRTCMIPLYIKLNTVSGDVMGPGVLLPTHKHVVGFFEQHMSGTTNPIYMLFTNCVTYNKYVTDIYMLFENSVTYNKCDHNIYMLFKTTNNIHMLCKKITKTYIWCLKD